MVIELQNPRGDCAKWNMDEAAERMVMKKQQKRDWSNLPSDVVGHVIGKLYWSDRIRIRSVCKSWLQVPQHGIPPIDRKPWLMGFKWKRKEDGRVNSHCSFFDTAINRPYNVEDADRGEERAIFYEATFQACRYGWLLFRKNRERGHCFCFFLYSPFTDEVIELPKLELDYPLRNINTVASMFLTSKSSDCLVFYLHNYHRDESIQISTCRPGDQTWKTLKFARDELEPYSVPRHATYLAGSFYCIFSRRELGAFNVARQEWSFLSKSWPQQYSNFLLDMELVGLPDFPCNLPKRAKLLKFDFSEKQWVEQLSTQIVDPDRRFLLSTAPAMGTTSEKSNETCHLYAYFSISYKDLLPPYKLHFIWFEPPMSGIWRKADLIQHS